jgi:hypothetical protein
MQQQLHCSPSKGINVNLALPCSSIIISQIKLENGRAGLKRVNNGLGAERVTGAALDNEVGDSGAEVESGAVREQVEQDREEYAQGKRGFEKLE